MDVIVVLGQSLNPDGSSPPALVKRAELAAFLSQQGGGLPIIATGGDPAHVGVSEAEVMRSELTRLGVPDVLVLLETKSLITVGNAYESIALLPSDCQRVLLVTSDFHMPRALYIFEAVFLSQGISVELVPHPVATRRWHLHSEQESDSCGQYSVRRPCTDRRPIVGDKICSKGGLQKGSDEDGNPSGWELSPEEEAVVVEVGPESNFKLSNSQGIVSSWLVTSMFTYKHDFISSAEHPNAMKLSERLRDEIDALVRRTPLDIQSTPGVHIPLPPQERLDEALSQVQKLLDDCELNDGQAHTPTESMESDDDNHDALLRG